jgi:hypothetical protein
MSPDFGGFGYRRTQGDQLIRGMAGDQILDRVEFFFQLLDERPNLADEPF